MLKCHSSCAMCNKTITDVFFRQMLMQHAKHARKTTPTFLTRPYNFTTAMILHDDILNIIHRVRTKNVNVNFREGLRFDLS